MAAVVYMCCGYQVGHLQHLNWLSAAAFLPFCIWAYLAMYKKFSLKNTLVASLLFYFFISSAHPGLIIGGFYFFLFLFVGLLFLKENKTVLSSKAFYLTHVIFIITLLLLSAAMLAGYADILPHFVRSEKLSLRHITTHGTSVQSWISSLIPMGVVKNNSFYKTDLSLRDSYFGLAFLVFFIVMLFHKKTAEQKFLLFTGSFFFLISSVEIFKQLIYEWMPLFGYVRLNGEFRIFTLLCVILTAAIQLNKFYDNKPLFIKTLQRIFWVGFALLFCMVAFSLYQSMVLKEGILFSYTQIFAQQGLAAKLKYFIDHIGFYDSFWIHGSLQIIFLFFIRKALLYKDAGYLTKLILADMIVACLLVIPFTGVSKSSPAQVQAMLNKAPNGFPIPNIHYLVADNPLPISDDDVLGSWSMYHKQIGTKTAVQYPIQLYNMKAFFMAENNSARNYYQQKGWLFLKNNSMSDSLSVINYTPTKITVWVKSEMPNALVLQQNYYPYWYYQIQQQKKPVQKEGINFIKIPVKKGPSVITISFEPNFIKNYMALSFAALLVTVMAIILLLAKKTKPTFLS